MQAAQDIIASLSDVEATTLINELYQKVYTAVPFEAMRQGLVSGQAEVETLKSLDPKISQKTFTAQESVLLCRHLLTSFAQDDQLAPLLVNTWEEIKTDDKMMVETILAVGLVVNVTLFMATSEIEYRDGKLTFIKSKADAGQLKAILSPVTEMVKTMSG